MPTFRPPDTNPEAPAGGGPLFSRYKLNRGQTVIWNQDGSFTLTRYPDVATLNAAKAYWLGGYLYTIDAATATALTAAGYGANIT